MSFDVIIVIQIIRDMQIFGTYVLNLRMLADFHHSGHSLTIMYSV